MHQVGSIPLDDEKSKTRANELAIANVKAYVDDDNVVFDVCLNQTNISGNNNKVSGRGNQLTLIC